MNIQIDCCADAENGDDVDDYDYNKYNNSATDNNAYILDSSISIS